MGACSPATLCWRDMVALVNAICGCSCKPGERVRTEKGAAYLNPQINIAFPDLRDYTFYINLNKE